MHRKDNRFYASRDLMPFNIPTEMHMLKARMCGYANPYLTET